MGRTGIQPGEAAAELYALIDRLPNLVPDGLHAYDGHIHDTRPRRRGDMSAQSGLESTLALRDRLLETGLAGAPARRGRNADLSDPCRARSPRRRMFARERSCFTTTATASRYPDLPFTPAALLLTRVVSHPQPRPALPRPGSQGGRRRPGRPSRALARARRCPAGRSQRGAPGHRDGPGRARSRSGPRCWRSRPTSAPPSPCTAAPTSSRTASLSASGKSPPAIACWAFDVMTQRLRTGRQHGPASRLIRAISSAW